MKIHMLARLFPKLGLEELQNLAQDIRKNGLREPIVRFKDEIVDGVNRYVACLRAGVEPRFVEWDGQGSLAGFVVSKNLMRRHLTPGQRALLAVKLEPFFAEEAQQRQEATRAKPGEKIGSKVGAKIPPPSEPGKTRDKVARIMKVSPRYVSQAKRLIKASPELAKKVEQGEETISSAMNRISPPVHPPHDPESAAAFVASLKPGQQKKWPKAAATLATSIRGGILVERTGKVGDLLVYEVARPIEELLALQPTGPVRDFIRAACKLLEYLEASLPADSQSSLEAVGPTSQQTVVPSGELKCAYGNFEPGHRGYDRENPPPACSGQVRWRVNSERDGSHFLCDAHREWAEKTTNPVWWATASLIADDKLTSG